MVAYSAWEGEDVTAVGLRNAAGDETAAMRSALYQDAGIRHSRHDAVAAHEVNLIGVCLGKEFGEQSALLYHSRCRIPVLAGIEVIEAMSQYAHGFVAAGERLSVRHDVYAIGQAAHDEHTGGELLQVGDEAADEVFAVRGAVAGSDDVDDPLLVEVGVAFIEEHQRGVVAILESLGIAVVVHRYRLYAVSDVVFQFYFCAFARLVAVLEGVHKLIRGIWEEASDVVSMLHDERGGACSSV